MSNTCSSFQRGLICRLQAGRSGVRIPIATRDFAFLRQHPYYFWGPTNFPFVGKHDFLPEVKQTKPQDDHSPTYSAMVKKKWSYNSTFPVCLYGLSRVIFTYSYMILQMLLALKLSQKGVQRHTFSLEVECGFLFYKGRLIRHSSLS